MKILILSFYFRPDLSAGSFRCTALVNALLDKMPAGGQIDVLTTLPNRYGSFSAAALEQETGPGLSIVRIALPVHKSGMRDQARAYVSYARAVKRHIQGKQYDLVYATSSRLMTAALGAWVARRKKIPLYLDIRDIFVDTIKDVLPKYAAIPARPLFAMLEAWTIRRAAVVNLVSRGFSEYFATRYPRQRFAYFTNGIDDEFLSVPERGARATDSRMLQVVYAGNIGEGQGLHEIVPHLATRMRGRIQFKVIGDGGRSDALRAALAIAGADNVELLPPMGREQLVKAYQDADVLFLHLNDYDAFRKVLPSKIFEYGGMGKPIWAGVAGHAADFLRSEMTNCAVFPPCDIDEAERVFGTLHMRDEARPGFVVKFARRRIADDMADHVLGELA